jgi:Protein of unknown function (DUF3800)
MTPILYLYFDEGGDFNFSPGGSAYFAMTCVAVRRPFHANSVLLDLKYDCLERGLSIGRFHATEDKQVVRDRVFAAIRAHLSDFHVYTVLISKNRANPSIRTDREIYTRVFTWLVKYVCPREIDAATRVVAVTDALPVNKKKDAVRQALKSNLKQCMPDGCHYTLHHLESQADLNLQIADYFNWAVGRKWELGDERSYQLIQPAMRGEVDLFAGGDRVYYAMTPKK